MPVEISYSKPTCVLYCKMQFGCAGIVVIVPNPKGKLIGSKWQFGQQIDNGTALVVVGTGLEVFVENDGLVVVVVEYQYQVVTNAVAGGVDAGGIFQVGIEHRPLTGRVAFLESAVVQIEVDFRSFLVLRGIQVKTAHNKILEGAEGRSAVFGLGVVGNFSGCKIVADVVRNAEAEVELSLFYRGLAPEQDGGVLTELKGRLSPISQGCDFLRLVVHGNFHLSIVAVQGLAPFIGHKTA